MVYRGFLKFNPFGVVVLVIIYIFPPVLPGAIERFDHFVVIGGTIRYSQVSDPEWGQTSQYLSAVAEPWV
jgi:hypothetical protein